MGNKFSKIMIDRSKIKSTIENWCEFNLSESFDITEDERKERICYKIKNNGRVIMLDFIKAAGGALTIYPYLGKEQSISMQIAEYIYKNLYADIPKTPYSNGFSIKMSYEDFDILIKLLVESDEISINNYSKKDTEGQAKYELYRLKSNLNDSVVLKYYLNTNRLQIQGKPLYLFNLITSMIVNDDNADELVEAHLEMCNISISKNEISEELKLILGDDLYNYLTVSQRALLSSSVVLNRIKIDGLGDYSYLIMPAMKAYEGFLRKIITDSGLSIAPKVSIGTFFKKDGGSVDFVMKTEYNTTLDSKTVNILEKMYNYYYSKRHPYMHASESDITTTISGSYDTSSDILDEIVHTMKNQYSEYCA